MKEIKAGQIVYLKPIGNAARRSTEIQEAVILKVGKKYFTLEGYRWFRERFFIDDMIHDGGQYMPNYKVYISEEEIEEEREYARLRERLNASFRVANLTMQKVKDILKIIES